MILEGMQWILSRQCTVNNSNCFPKNRKGGRPKAILGFTIWIRKQITRDEMVARKWKQ